MGTSYTIHKDSLHEIELDEMSNKLSLCVTDDGGQYYFYKLTPEEIIQMALQMLKVCSYWTEEGAVEKAIAEFKAKGYYW